jgi:anti-anti-sigma factor
MLLHSGQRLLDVEHVGEATVVRFRVRALVDEAVVDAVGRQLSHLAEHGGRRFFVLNCDQVESLTSAMLAKLITLRRKVQADGRVVLCHIPAHLEDLFHRLWLTKLLPVYGDEEQALHALQNPGG